MQISLYPDFQKLQDQLHFDVIGIALWPITACLISEPAFKVLFLKISKLELFFFCP